MHKKGFTLVEMMIAVAIIGILLAIGQPMYRKYKAQSVMVQAKDELVQLYTAEKTFKEEYKTYHWHLPVIGFVPAQIDSTQNNYPPISGAERYYGIRMTDGGGAPSLATLGLAAPGNLTYDPSTGFRASSDYCTAASVALEPAENSAFGAELSLATTSTAFVAVALGCPMKWQDVDSSNLDRWSIDQDQNLNHVNQQN